MSSNDPAVVVPSNVLVPEGESSAQFEVTTTNVAIVTEASLTGEKRRGR